MKEPTVPRRLTRQEILDDIFKVHGDRTRVVQLSVPGREITLAHVIGRPDPCVYTNLCLEIGFDQGESVPALLRDEGFDEIEVVRDLAGLDRVVKARKSRR